MKLPDGAFSSLSRLFRTIRSSRLGGSDHASRCGFRGIRDLPKGRGHEASEELIEGINIYRHSPDLNRVKELPGDPRWRNGRRFLVSSIGVIGQSEGLDLLLSSIEHIVRTQARNDIQFVIMGAGPEWQAITKMYDKMNLIDYVTFTGRMSGKELARCRTLRLGPSP